MGGRRLDALWWCYLCLGCATLTPWNSFITAADYWELRHPVREGLPPAMLHAARRRPG